MTENRKGWQFSSAKWEFYIRVLIPDAAPQSPNICGICDMYLALNTVTEDHCVPDVPTGVK